jgi:hypothetical protein
LIWPIINVFDATAGKKDEGLSFVSVLRVVLNAPSIAVHRGRSASLGAEITIDRLGTCQK